MSWVVVGLVGGQMGAALINKGSGGGDVGFKEVPQTKEATKARKKLMEMATGPLPEIPRRGIAPLPEMTEERQLARTTAKDMVGQQDIFSLPEVQGIIHEANVSGNLLANRLSRALQASGSFTSTPGRDVLGRAVTDVQKSIASSLAPFASEERGRRASMIPLLEGMGLTEEERGRGFTQAQLDALFAKEYEVSQQPMTYTAPLLKAIIGLQPDLQPIIQGQRPSAITELAPLLGPMLTAAMMGKPSGAIPGVDYMPPGQRMSPSGLPYIP